MNSPVETVGGGISYRIVYEIVIITRGTTTLSSWFFTLDIFWRNLNQQTGSYETIREEIKLMQPFDATTTAGDAGKRYRTSIHW